MERRFLTADYRDGSVRMNGKTYPAGTFVVRLLNQYYKDDLAGRLSVYKMHGWNVLEQLHLGYLNDSDFTAAGAEIQTILDTLPRLSPFEIWDVAAERARIQRLFSQETAAQITAHFRVRSDIGNMDPGQILFGNLPAGYDRDVFESINATIRDADSTIRFYHSISDSMRKAFGQLRTFVERADEADKLDEAHLLPLALELFDKAAFPVDMEYVSQRKHPRNKLGMVARRLHFDSYYSFIVTDFFEGLSYGHYPRRCEICGSYFLMTCARRQRYCSGTAPQILRGRKVTCRQYAAATKRKERAEDDPIIDLYTRRCNSIRSMKSAGKISLQLAQTALSLAKEYKYRAQLEADYANGQYTQDMSWDTLRRAAEK